MAHGVVVSTATRRLRCHAPRSFTKLDARGLDSVTFIPHVCHITACTVVEAVVKVYSQSNGNCQISTTIAPKSHHRNRL